MAVTNHVRKRLAQFADVRFAGQVFDQNLGHAFTNIRRRASQHFKQDHPHRVDVHRFVVLAFADFGSHVVDAADGCGVASLLSPTDGFAERVVADFDGAVFEENIVRLQIAMHDPRVMQITQTLDQFASKEQRLVFADALTTLLRLALHATTDRKRIP